jgi:hypothetical protein
MRNDEIEGEEESEIVKTITEAIRTLNTNWKILERNGSDSEAFSSPFARPVAVYTRHCSHLRAQDSDHLDNVSIIVEPSQEAFAAFAARAPSPSAIYTRHCCSLCAEISTLHPVEEKKIFRPDTRSEEHQTLGSNLLLAEARRSVEEKNINVRRSEEQNGEIGGEEESEIRKAIRILQEVLDTNRSTLERDAAERAVIRGCINETIRILNTNSKKLYDASSKSVRDLTEEKNINARRSEEQQTLGRDLLESREDVGPQQVEEHNLLDDVRRPVEEKKISLDDACRRGGSPADVSPDITIGSAIGESRQTLPAPLVVFPKLPPRPLADSEDRHAEDHAAAEEDGCP